MPTLTYRKESKKKLETDDRTCGHYNSCSAPLCPLNPQSLEQGIWYADEEVCRRNATTFGSPRWLRVQRKASRKVRDRDHYFTKAMLEVIYAVRPGTTGIDPNNPDFRKREKAWVAEKADSLQSKIDNAKRKASLYSVFCKKEGTSTGVSAPHPLPEGDDTGKGG